MSDSLPIAVVGAGAWGTALSALLAKKGHAVTIWSYEPEIAESINQHHLTPYLSDVSLPAELRAETELAQAIRGADVVLSASPSQFVRAVMTEAARNLAAFQIFSARKIRQGQEKLKSAPASPISLISNASRTASDAL